MPKIIKIDENTFNVTITAAIETTHKVTLSEEYHNELTGGNISKEKLIEKSFKFLLQRESNSEILKEFDLQLIETYFPTFSQEMKNQIR